MKKRGAIWVSPEYQAAIKAYHEDNKGITRSSSVGITVELLLASVLKPYLIRLAEDK